jgi:hypothetical protein
LNSTPGGTSYGLSSSQPRLEVVAPLFAIALLGLGVSPFLKSILPAT